MYPGRHLGMNELLNYKHHKSYVITYMYMWIRLAD